MQTLGLGFTWEQLAPGQRFRTLNRTLTETDLVMFTGVTGMLETIFIDRTFGAEKGAIQGQFVPAASQRRCIFLSILPVCWMVCVSSCASKCFPSDECGWYCPSLDKYHYPL